MRWSAFKLARLLFVLAMTTNTALQRASASDIVIKKVTPNVINPGQSLATSYRIDVQFDLTYLSTANEDVGMLISRNIANNQWDCYNPKNFDVLINPGPGKSTFHARIARVSYPHAKSCSQAFAPGIAKDAQLWIEPNQPRWHNLVGKVTVRLLNLKDLQGGVISNIGSSTDVVSIQWKLSIITVSAQTAQNETLIDNSISKNTIYQFPVSTTATIWPTKRGGFYVDTNDLFATDERDSKSAFEGGFGFQYGLLRRWAVPVKLEEQIVGNQVATNLASQTSLQAGMTSPWRPLGPKTTWIAWNIAPSIAVTAPYTHRIHQYVAPGGTALPVNDFAINPAGALAGERLLEVGGNGSSIPPTFALYWEADLGMYYLPRQRTSKGTQRAEGSGDVSFLVPLSDFGILPGLNLDQTTQVNLMQIRVKYQDTVDPTNNYTRTKGWTFGLELTVKK